MAEPSGVPAGADVPSLPPWKNLLRNLPERADPLLTAVAKSADDLHLFHDTVAKAPLAPLEPFPRAFVTLVDGLSSG